MQGKRTLRWRAPTPPGEQAPVVPRGPHLILRHVWHPAAQRVLASFRLATAPFPPRFSNVNVSAAVTQCKAPPVRYLKAP